VKTSVSGNVKRPLATENSGLLPAKPHYSNLFYGKKKVSSIKKIHSVCFCYDENKLKKGSPEITTKKNINAFTSKKN